MHDGPPVSTTMIVTPYPVTLFLPPSKTPRSNGLHVSGIIRCIAQETNILPMSQMEDLSLSDVREITDQTAVLRICIGLAWEEWYIPNILAHQQGVIDHPGEMKLSGVYMTHDGESVSVIITKKGQRPTVVIHEVKATYKSTRTVGDLTSQWMWLAQMKAYCLAAKTRYARLHVLFLCGDYTFPIRPVPLCWDIEFTDQELADNWSLLLQYKDERLAKERR